MQTLTLPDLTSLESIEEALVDVAASDGAALQLPKDLASKRRGALQDAARLQLLATWARNASRRELHFHAANDVDTVLAELCDHAPGITALRLCDKVVVGETSRSRRDALEPAAEKMKNSDELVLSQIIRGRTIDLNCVSGSRVQYLRPLFSERNAAAVRDRNEMLETLELLSQYIARRDAEQIPSDFWRACAVFASELIKNTQQHATSDHANRPYLRHVEGLILGWQTMPEEIYSNDFSGHPRLQEFWNREASPVQGGPTRALRSLQLSFFDTGPGLAGRATGQETTALSLGEEREAMLKCLTKNVTTKRETGAGNGLPLVLEELRSIGGLFRIRSGRHCIFNAFARGEERDVLDFQDWSPKPLAPVCGTVISILVPIKK